MTFNLYKAGDLREPHEIEQMKKVIHSLHAEFMNRADENCILIIAPEIFRSHLDALFIKDGIFFILELKDYQDEFKISYDKNTFEEKWTNDNGQELPYDKSYPPITQVKNYRYYLYKFIEKYYESKIKYPQFLEPRMKKNNQEDPIERFIKRNINGWIVTGELSRPILPNDLELLRFLKIIPLEDVAKEISKYTGYKKRFEILPPSVIEEFLKDMMAESIPLDTSEDLDEILNELFRGRITDFEGPTACVVQVIKRWIESGDYDLMDKALERLDELNLKNHIKNVIECWNKSHRSDVKKRSLEILIKWRYNNLGEILDKALKDEDEKIKIYALNYLTKHSCQEPFKTLKKMLSDENERELLPKVITALSITGDENAIRVLVEFARNNFLNKSILEFGHLYKRLGLVNLDDDQKFENKRDLIREVLKSILNALSYLNYKDDDFIDWLIKIIKDPTSLGFETKDYSELIFTDYFEIFRTACESLKRIGNGINGISENLINQMDLFPPDYQHYIISVLGEIGDKKAIDPLITLFNNYLKNSDYEEVEYLIHIIADSLTKLDAKNKKFLDDLLELFIIEVKNDDIYAIDLFEDLLNLNKYKLEYKIWEEEKKYNYDEIFKKYGRFIIECGTEYSFDKCKKIVENDKTRKYKYGPWEQFSPLHIMEEISHRKPEIYEKAKEIGSKYLESNREDLIATGILLLRDDFKSNPEKLEKYESDNSSLIRETVLVVYTELNDEKKIEKFVMDNDIYIASDAFEFLKKYSKNHYDNFYCYYDNNISLREFLFSNDSLILKIMEVEDNYINKNEKFFSLPYFSLPYSSITYFKIIEIGSIDFGIIINTKSDKSYILIPRMASTWNHLILKNDDINVEEILLKIYRKIWPNCTTFNLNEDNHQGIENAYEGLKSSFIKENIKIYNRDSMGEYSKIFEQLFKPEMIKFKS